MAFPAAKSGFSLEDRAQMGPDEITRKRRLAEALLAESQGIRDIRHPLEGMAQMAQALVGNLKTARLDRAEREGKEGANALYGAGMGLGAFPAAPAPGSGVTPGANNAPVSKATSNMADGPKGQESYMNVKSGIAETAQALGISPVDLATAISYETGGTFDPTQGGPTTKWGKHRGLIQFGEPQAAKYGVDWNDPVGSQLGADKAVAKYLRDAGVTPGMGLLDIYSAINAGGVGKYSASDAAAGGAPGTVRDKVEQQMAGHRAKAMAMYGGDAGPATAQAPASVDPVQVASLDPRTGVEAAMREQGITDPNDPLTQALIKLKQQNPDGTTAPVAASAGSVAIAPDAYGSIDPQKVPPINDAQAVAGQEVPLPAPVTPPPAALPQQAAVGTALLAQNDPQNSMTLGAPPVTAQGPDLRTLMNMAGNEFMNPAQQKMIEALTGQRMRQADPGYQLDLETKRAQLDAIKNPRMTVSEKANYDLNVAKFGEERANQIRDDERADAELKIKQGDVGKTDTIKNYDAYYRDEVNAGRIPKSREVYDLQKTKAGAQVINNNLGGNTSEFVKKSDEAASKRLGDIVQGGYDAKDFSSQLQTLAELAPMVNTGKGAEVKAALGPYAEALGIPIEGLGETQAFDAIVSKLAPQMRPAGSGASSDFDAKQFLKSLPSLGNNPEGNAIITATFQALQDNKMQAAEIAAKAYDDPENGGITWQEAEKQIRALPSPYDRFKEYRKAAKDGGERKTKTGVTWGFTKD